MANCPKKYQVYDGCGAVIGGDCPFRTYGSGEQLLKPCVHPVETKPLQLEARVDSQPTTKASRVRKSK